jgi:hypothetical protein
MSESISSSAQHVTLQQNLYEEKSKHASLAQQNGFGPAFLHRMLWLAKGTAEPSTYC